MLNRLQSFASILQMGDEYSGVGYRLAQLQEMRS